MKTFTRDLGFVNFNGEEMQWIKFNNVTVYEAWRKLIASGVPPITLQKCKGVDDGKYLLDYKIYGNSVQKANTQLPTEYRELEYIESTGTQYIVIDYIASGNTVAKGSFRLTTSSTASILFGSRKDATSRGYALNWGGTSPYTYINTYNAGGTPATTTKSIDTLKHTFEKRYGDLYIDDELIHDKPNQTFTTPDNMVIFGCSTNGTISHKCKAQIYNLQFYDDDILKVDLIPCYRKSDNEIGMYDLVTGTFYTNQGTETFVKGNNMPIEVECVGEKTRNLFDINSATSILSINSNSTIKKVDGNFVIKRTTSAYAMGIEFSYPFKAGKYALKIGYLTTNYSPNSRYIMYFADKSICVNASSVGYPNTVKQLNIPEDMTVTIIIYANDDNVVGNECTFSIMLSEGYDSVPYEPYGYKVPITISGKNLFNPNKLIGGELVKYNGVQCYSYKDTNNNVGSGNFSYEDEFKENTRYTFTTKIYFEDTSKNTSLEFLYTDGTKNSVAISKSGTIYKFTTTSGKTLKQIRGAYMWGIIRYMDLTVTQLEEGTKATTFEPYYEPVATNIYLDEPLRKAGDYADYIDYQKQQQIKLIDKKTFDGTENWEVHTTISDGAVFRIDNVLNPLIGASQTSTFMTHFNLTKIYSTASFENGLYRFSSSSTEVTQITGNRLYISSPCTTVDEFKAWLSENKPSIYYPVAEVDDVKTIDLPTIPTNKGTNIIEIDTEVLPSNMEVKYMGKE